jgi:hypothetical protein
MKKLFFTLVILASSTVSSFATINYANILFSKNGIWGYAGGCFPGPGWCVDFPMGNMFDGVLGFNTELSDVVTVAVPPSSPAYPMLGQEVIFGQDAPINPQVAGEVGLSPTVLIKQGTYPVIYHEDGTASVTLKITKN